MCKKLLSWFKCKKNAEVAPTEGDSTESQSFGPKIMNEDAVKRFSSSWVSHNADCFMRSSHVAKMLDVNIGDLNAKILPNMQRVWINEHNMCTVSPSLGLDLGLNMQDIEKLACLFNINDNKNLSVLRNKYTFALRNSGFVM